MNRSYFLVCNSGTDEGKKHELKLGRNTIGRSPDNDIVIIDGSLSRRHAEINLTPKQDQYTITDLDSLNGTCVNGSRIHHAEISDGDSLGCGTVMFQFSIKTHESSTPDTGGISIIKQIAPEQSRIVMGDILDQQKTGLSVLKIREQNAEKRALDKLKILLEIGKQMACPRNSRVLERKILDLLFEIMDVDRAAIMLVDKDTWELECKAHKLKPDIPDNERFYSSRITKYVCQHGNAILTDNASFDQRFESHSVISQAIQSAMCVPLKPDNDVIGVLYVDNLSMANVYTEEDLEFLTAMANQAAVALDNAMLYQQMREQEVQRNKLEQFFPPAVSRKIQEEGNLAIVDREVTALFADISGFTRMSSTMEPRKVIEMLNDYFEVMVEGIVFRHEGTLEKYIGDALFAIWGAPYPQPDKVDRAIKAAIEMQRAVLSLNQEWKEQGRKPIDIHIGINTGKVAAGNIGSERLFQYATIGDTTNVTSRICNVAQAREIVISETTYHKLENRNLPMEKMAPVKVKGKDEPLQLYRLLWDKVEPFTTFPV